MKSYKNTRIVLFNYGGGMRGLIPAHIMTRIEEKTGLHMTDMVDIFAGPSTGAILNAALNVPDPENPNKPRFKAQHMVKFYEREGLKIFPPDRFRDFRGFIHDFNNRTMRIGQLNALFRHGHYDPGHLSKCLYDMYGDLPLSAALKNIVIPVYNIDGEQVAQLEGSDNSNAIAPGSIHNRLIDDGGHAVWMKNFRSGVVQPSQTHVRMHDAVLASCAAPTYFPCHHFEADGHALTGIDGSIFDNPCVSYMGALRHHIPEDTRVIMILLGTGYNLRSFTKEDWNSYGGLGVVDPVNDLPLINILFNATESALVEGFRSELGDDLFVFNKSLLDGGENTPSEAIDDARDGNLAKMKFFAESIMEENAAQLERLCHILTSHAEGGTAKPSFWSKLFGA